MCVCVCVCVCVFYIREILILFAVPCEEKGTKSTEKSLEQISTFKIGEHIVIICLCCLVGFLFGCWFYWILSSIMLKDMQRRDVWDMGTYQTKSSNRQSEGLKVVEAQMSCSREQQPTVWKLIQKIWLQATKCINHVRVKEDTEEPVTENCKQE